MTVIETTNRKRILADMALLLVTLIWGGTFVMVKDAVSSYPVFPFIAIRFGLATVALLLIGWRRLPSLGWRGVGVGTLCGLFLFAGYAFQTAGLRHVTASKAGFITGLSVVMVPGLAALLLRRAPPAGALIGILLATVGLAMLTLNNTLRVERADLLVLGCAFSFALHIVAVSAFAPHHDPLALTIVQVVTVALVSGATGLFMDRPLAMPTPTVWFAAAFTGILATAVAFTAQTAMQRFTTPTHTALIFAAEPVFAALFGVLLAGEIMTSRAVAGGILIVVGTIIGEMHWSRRAAALVSRFIAPQYMAVPLLLVLALTDQVSWQRGLLWAAGVGVLSVVGPLLIFWRELRRGGISDWHVSNREERLQPILIIPSILAPILAAAILIAFDGPPQLLVGLMCALAVIVVNILVTVRWKISAHVSGVAATTLVIAITLGMSASPMLLLIPLVAWARVKVGAHTVMQTIVGGVTGLSIAFATMRLFGFA